MTFTKDNERRTEDGYENSGFNCAKSVSIVIRLKEAASPCETDFVISWRVFLLNIVFTRTGQRATGSYDARFCELS